MKKNFINYYALIMMIIFIIYNLLLRELKINGLLYQIFMVLLIIINTIILIAYRNQIEYKVFVIIVYSFLWLFSKNILQCLFNFSNMMILCIIGFRKNNFIKVITTLIAAFILIFSPPLLFGFLLTFGTDLNEEQELNDIYGNMHYYCEENYEVYSYSAGAFDGFHYSIGKHYDILNIDDIIHISYNERNEITKQEYETYLKNHHCRLVGENNGYK